MHEREIEISTSDGQIDLFICHPEENGPFPPIIMYMDAPGIREELRDMARRLGTVGYYVMLPNLYYRNGREGDYGFDLSKIRVDEAEREKMFEVMRTLTNARVVSDTKHLLAHITADEAANSGPAGCVGYCMSGQFVVSIAATYSTEFAAIASFYGVGIVTEEKDSPHLMAQDIKGTLYLAFASDDPFVPASTLDSLPRLMTNAGVKHRVEIYPGTEHGFAFPQRPAYVKAAGERHWERLFALFDRELNE
ncbi:MAG: dienelactone hydrolase family protein [Pseudomonadota bacterium]|nr:dienelactone hydrolase family protein [Pseudomonadota bacterium]